MTIKVPTLPDLPFTNKDSWCTLDARFTSHSSVVRGRGGVNGKGRSQEGSWRSQRGRGVVIRGRGSGQRGRGGVNGEKGKGLGRR